MFDFLQIKTRRAELCTPCAKGMQAEGFTVRPIKRGVNQKITCERCGKRRYGGVYELGGAKRVSRPDRDRGIS